MKKIILDEYYSFERPTGYVPQAFFNTEAEIRFLCKKNKILVHEIIKFDTYKVIGKKIKNKKSFDKAYDALNNKTTPAL